MLFMSCKVLYLVNYSSCQKCVQKKRKKKKTVSAVRCKVRRNFDWCNLLLAMMLCFRERCFVCCVVICLYTYLSHSIMLHFNKHSFRIIDVYRYIWCYNRDWLVRYSQSANVSAGKKTTNFYGCISINRSILQSL